MVKDNVDTLSKVFVGLIAHLVGEAGGVTRATPAAAVMVLKLHLHRHSTPITTPMV